MTSATRLRHQRQARYAAFLSRMTQAHTSSTASTGYVGRFAPSPTGPLHAGSMVAALASWLDARAARGRWLVRIEDIDTPRCSPEASATILRQLADCGMESDAPPMYQSERGARYRQALDQLVAEQWAYPCACTRRDMEAALAQAGHVHERHSEHVYPGTCRDGLHGRAARSWRFHATRFQAQLCDSGASPVQRSGVHWTDRRLGAQFQDVASAVGDFALLRADGIWAYQLAVVVDDADQEITHVVRGEDLADNTPRQILLQTALRVPTPAYLHTPLVRAEDGEKLSKQHGAPAADTSQPLQALAQAACALGLPMPPTLHQGSTPDALAFWVGTWRDRIN